MVKRAHVQAGVQHWSHSQVMTSGVVPTPEEKECAEPARSLKGQCVSLTGTARDVQALLTHTKRCPSLVANRGDVPSCEPSILGDANKARL